MEKNKVTILSVKKNEITIRLKKKRPQVVFYCVFFIIAFFTLIMTIDDSKNTIKNSMIKIYNPVSSLYNDNSDIVFTNGGILEKDSVNLIVPIKGSIYEIERDGTIYFDIVSSIMVVASDSGVVANCGVGLDGTKFIRIKHSLGVETLIENVDILGAKVGDIVKSGQDIATAKLGTKVRMQIFLDGTRISNIKINQSKIVWE